MLRSVNTLYSGRIKLHVLAKNDYPSSGLTVIQKKVYFTNVFHVWDLNFYKLKSTLWCGRYRM